MNNNFYRLANFLNAFTSGVYKYNVDDPNSGIFHF